MKTTPRPSSVTSTPTRSSARRSIESSRGARSHGHAAHFLERLSRVNRSQADFALGLYRDPTLLRWVLSEMCLPEEAGRVALSLNDNDVGPYVVVTREADFVTCLGPGMNPRGLHVVSRAKLDAVSAKCTNTLERLTQARREMRRRNRPTTDLLRKLIVAPDRISREDFLLVSAWEPLVTPVIRDVFASMNQTVYEVGPTLRRARRRSSGQHEALRAYWMSAHATSHFAILSTVGGRRESFADWIEDRGVAFTFGLQHTWSMPLVLRSAWATARMGKVLLPAWKDAVSKHSLGLGIVETLTPLVAIGSRSRALRGEVKRIIQSIAAQLRAGRIPELGASSVKALTALCETATRVMEMSDEQLEARRRAIGSRLLARLGIEPDAEGEFARAIPLATMGNALRDWHCSADWLWLTASVVREDAEKLYLPCALLDQVYRPWQPMDTWKFLAPVAAHEKEARKPVVVPTSTGRNEPCPCGCGRKYKRCAQRPQSVPASPASPASSSSL